MPKLTINALVAQQKYKNNGFLDYTVSKIGATYDLGAGLNVGAYFKNTDAKKVWYTVDGKDWSKNRLVGFVSYSF
jgi:hypothetical protein